MPSEHIADGSVPSNIVQLDFPARIKSDLLDALREAHKALKTDNHTSILIILETSDGITLIRNVGTSWINLIGKLEYAKAKLFHRMFNPE